MTKGGIHSSQAENFEEFADQPVSHSPSNRRSDHPVRVRNILVIWTKCLSYQVAANDGGDGSQDWVNHLGGKHATNSTKSPSEVTVDSHGDSNQTKGPTHHLESLGAVLAHFLCPGGRKVSFELVFVWQG